MLPQTAVVLLVLNAASCEVQCTITCVQSKPLMKLILNKEEDTEKKLEDLVLDVLT